MANDSNAPAKLPGDTAAERDFKSFYAALTASARGKAFLDEYARRNRHADTQVLLGALDRLEALVRADGAALTRLRDELHMILIAIRLTRPEIEAGNPQAKATKLAKLLDLLEQRIAAMADGKTAGAAPPDDIFAQAQPEPVAPEKAPAAVAKSEPAPPEPARVPLSVVPRPDEPELPIPTPAGAAPPAIALVQEIRLGPAMLKVEPVKALPGPDPVWRPIFDNSEGPTAAVMPDIDFTGDDAGPPAPTVTSAPDTPAQPAAADPPAPPRDTALAAIMALSEEERIALFT
jgi:hypothetical protein